MGECNNLMNIIEKNIINETLINKWQLFYKQIKNNTSSNTILKKWITYLKSSISNFSEPELYIIYTISEFFFTKNEVIQGSKKHFTNSKMWEQALLPTTNIDKQNHVLNANHWINKNLNSINSHKINFIDFGSGLLSSLVYIATNNKFKNISYLGIDINSDFVNISNSLLNKKFKTKNKNLLLRLNPKLEKNLEIDILNNLFFKDYKTFENIRSNISQLDQLFVIQENINDLKLHKSLSKYENEIDLITANYCLHHIPNSILIKQNILNKNCFQLFGDNVSDWHPQIINSISSFLFNHINIIDFINNLQLYNDGKIRKEKMSNYITNAFKNHRLNIFKLISSLLKTNGKFILSDPDGFSDWNEIEIYENDWSHAIAHFSSLKYDLELIEKNIPQLEFSEAYLQMQNTNNEVETISLTREEILNCNYLSKIKEYKNWHLGYIIGFHKINI